MGTTNKRHYVKARKTDYKIAEALFTLLEKKALDNITIQEICDEAGIHRSTFYTHFGSIFDVIQFLAREILTGLEASFSTADALSTSVDFFLQFYQKYGRAIRNINKTKYKDILDKQILEVLEDVIARLFYAQKPSNLSKAAEKWLVSYHAAGILSLQEVFLTQDLKDKETRKNLAQLFSALFQSGEKTAYDNDGK